MSKTETPEQVVSRVISLLGSQANLARALGYEDVRNVSPWTRGGRLFPPHHCVSIERATNGAVMRWHLHPNDWHLIWPELIGAEGAPPVVTPEPATAGQG